MYTHLDWGKAIKRAPILKKLQHPSQTPTSTPPRNLHPMPATRTIPSSPQKRRIVTPEQAANSRPRATRPAVAAPATFMARSPTSATTQGPLTPRRSRAVAPLPTVDESVQTQTSATYTRVSEMPEPLESYLRGTPYVAKAGNSSRRTPPARHTELDDTPAAAVRSLAKRPSVSLPEGAHFGAQLVNMLKPEGWQGQLEDGGDSYSVRPRRRDGDGKLCGIMDSEGVRVYL
ncbi:hypothetical protein C8R43DRAFT_1173656 [Mycena crocata]|nr:hypothetical protein C8R43DRAFT_1173656 [Mycena crocata]